MADDIIIDNTWAPDDYRVLASKTPDGSEVIVVRPVDVQLNAANKVYRDFLAEPGEGQYGHFIAWGAWLAALLNICVFRVVDKKQAFPDWNGCLAKFGDRLTQEAAVALLSFGVVPSQE